MMVARLSYFSGENFKANLDFHNTVHYKTLKARRNGVMIKNSGLLLLLCAFFFSSNSFVAAANVIYQYDDLNRLVGVISVTNSVNQQYSYDEVGNITSYMSMNISDDRDFDYLSDDIEINISCTDVDDGDSDDDGILDGLEDANMNGLLDAGETDPCNADSDGDGLLDGLELGYALADIGFDTNSAIFVADTDTSSTTDPLSVDSDGDGLNDSLEDFNQNGMVDAGETDAANEDSDSDGALDGVDGAPLDGANSGGIVYLPNGSLDAGQYGYGWGSDEHYTLLVASFQSNGQERLFHVQSYDIDDSDEVGVYLNGNYIGALSGADAATGRDSLWWLPADMQQIGENRLELRQNTPGEVWGVQRLGLYDLGAAFGNLNTLANGDTEHANGFELHFQGNNGRLLALSGWNNYLNDEINISLNGTVLGGLPADAAESWTTEYQLFLPEDKLEVADNVLTFVNSIDPGANWGVQLLALRDADARLGNIPGVETGYMDGVSYLVPVGSSVWGFKLNFFDVDAAGEVQILVNGVEQDFAPVTPDNCWGGTQQVLIALGRSLAAVEVHNTSNPPGAETWGVMTGEPMTNISAVLTIINSILLR